MVRGKAQPSGGSGKYGRRGRHHRIRRREVKQEGEIRKQSRPRDTLRERAVSLLCVCHLTCRLQVGKPDAGRKSVVFSCVVAAREEQVFDCRILCHLSVTHLKIYFEPSGTSRNKEGKRERSLWTSRRRSGICHQRRVVSAGGPGPLFPQVRKFGKTDYSEVPFNTVSPALVGLRWCLQH